MIAHSDKAPGAAFSENADRQNSPWNIKIRDLNNPASVLETLYFESQEAMCAHLRENSPRQANGYYDLTGKDLKNADLRGAHLVAADLTFSDLRGADLRDADMLGAILSHTQFNRAKLRGAEFGAAETTGADFSGSDLTAEQFGVMLGWPARLANGQMPPGHPDEMKNNNRTLAP